MRALHGLLIFGLCCMSALAAANPLVVLREAAKQDAAALRAAAAEAPDEAVVVLRSGSSALTRALEGGDDPALRLLPELARAACVPESVCPAAAVFYRQIHAGAITREQAMRIASNRAAYFHQLVALRMQGPDALFDRVLHEQAETIRSAWMEGGEGRRSLGMDRIAPRDLYAVLAYGQREESEVSFAKFFDHEFAPRMKGGRLMPAIAEARGLRLRHFLVEAIRADRVRELLEVAGRDRARLVATAMRGVANEQESALAAEVLEAYAGLISPRPVESALLEESKRHEAMAGLLAAWLHRVRGGLVNKELAALANRFRKYLPAADQLQAADLCHERICTQRLMFFDDDDGAASFRAFQAQYQQDPNWTWESRSGYVRVWRKGGAGLTVEVFANRPQSNGGAVSMAWLGKEKQAQEAFALELKARGVARVFVQRGHAYHVPKAIQTIPSEAKLVYLGGCRGTENLSGVLDRAPQAQIIATRSTGTMDVNDPLLKAMNDELADKGRIAWAEFWIRQRARFSNSALFGRYIPPHRNGAVILMQGWRRLRTDSIEAARIH